MTLVRRLVERSGVVVAAHVALLSVLGAGAFRLRTDNTAGVFFPRDDPRVVGYRSFADTFGGDAFARVAFSGPSLWTARGLRWVRTVERRAAAVAGVRHVSVLEADGAWPPADPVAWGERLADRPLARDLGLIGADRRWLTLLVELEPLRAEAGREVVAGLRSALRDPPPGVSGGVAGPPALSLALDASSREVGTRSFPLLVAFAAALLAVFFRRLPAVVAPLAFVGACEAGCLGAMGWAGVRLNLVLAILPPLLFVIALATAVHVTARLRQVARIAPGPAAAVEATYRDMGWAVLWTGVTTCLGFASLTTSAVPPVRALGQWAAIGLALITLLAFSLLPALARLAVSPRASGRGESRVDRAARRVGGRLASGCVRKRGAVLAGAGALAVLAGAGLPRLTVESNALHYFAQDHELRALSEALQAAGIGVAALELDLRLPSPEGGPGARGLRTVEQLERLARLTDGLRGLPSVLGAVSAGDLLEEAVRLRIEEAPDEPDMRYLVLALMQVDPEGRARLRRFVSPRGDRARVTVFVPLLGHADMQPVQDAVLAAARSAFPEAAASVTGELPLLLETQRRLLQTMTVSLALTLACVAVVLWTILGSVQLAALAVLPNAWPIVLVVGSMGWSGIPLDIATAMVASTCVGLAVDDTIHALGHFRELAPGRARDVALQATLERTAPAFVLTGLILAAGFCTCALSSFAPTARFGALAAAGIALAVLCDLTLLPALLGHASDEAARRAGEA